MRLDEHPKRVIGGHWPYGRRATGLEHESLCGQRHSADRGDTVHDQSHMHGEVGTPLGVLPRAVEGVDHPVARRPWPRPVLGIVLLGDDRVVRPVSSQLRDDELVGHAVPERGEVLARALEPRSELDEQATGFVREPRGKVVV